MPPLRSDAQLSARRPKPQRQPRYRRSGSRVLGRSPNTIPPFATRFEPGKDLCITETADAACGGNPWASTFLDTFRYLIGHASLAQRGVKVIMHNTLAASDYGL